LTDSSLSDLLHAPLESIAKEFDLHAILTDGLSELEKNSAVEKILIQKIMHDHSILLRPLTGPGRDLLIHWIRKFELFNLKALIRGKINAMAPAQIQEKLHKHEELRDVMTADNTLENRKYKFNEVVDNLLLDFVHTKLDLYKKLTDKKVNDTFKSKWFEGYLRESAAQGGQQAILE